VQILVFFFKYCRPGRRRLKLFLHQSAIETRTQSVSLLSSVHHHTVRQCRLQVREPRQDVSTGASLKFAVKNSSTCYKEIDVFSQMNIKNKIICPLKKGYIICTTTLRTFCHARPCVHVHDVYSAFYVRNDSDMQLSQS
jgi:hypothetical protein